MRTATVAGRLARAIERKRVGGATTGLASAAMTNGRARRTPQEPPEIAEPQRPVRRASRIRSTVRTPSPGTRSSSSRSAVFTSTGKPPRLRERPGQLRIDRQVEHAVRHAGGDLVGREPVEADEPVRLIQPMLAHQRRRLSAAAAVACGIGLNAE